MNKDVTFYKKHKGDKIFWIDNASTTIGEHLFTFDRKKIYNLFSDYPHRLTADELKIFDQENPEWRIFFKDRRQDQDATP